MKKITKEELAEQNAQFDSMDTTSKRKAIAQDVINAIKAEKLIAETGNYYNVLREGGDKYDEIEDSQCELLRDDVTCTTCAMGAVLMSRIKLGNTIELNSRANGAHGREIIKGMDGIFTEEEMRLLETAFEGTAYESGRHLLTDEQKEDGYSFRDAHPNSTERLLALMYGIVRTGNVTLNLEECKPIVQQ